MDVIRTFHPTMTIGGHRLFSFARGRLVTEHRKTMFRALGFAKLAGAAAFFALCLAPATSQATSVSAVCLVSPGAGACPAAPPTISGLTQGVNFSLSLFMEDAVNIGDFFIDGITWPAASLSLVSIVDGGFLGACALPPCFQYDSSVGSAVSNISFFDFGPPHPVTGSGSLAILTFHPLVSGTVDLAFTGLILVTDLDDNLSTLFFAGQGATLDIAPAASEVPEPATILLLGSGIAGVLARRRRSTRIP
jgi:hypothetical protein